MLNTGSKVIILSRCDKRSIETHKLLEREAESKYINLNNVEFRTADLADLKSVEEFADKFIKENQSIDTVILNAGLQYTGDKEMRFSKQGLELTFAVNHISHQFLIQKIFNLIERSEYPRIVITSSEVHNPLTPGGRIGYSASLGDMNGLSSFDSYKTMVDGTNFNADKAYKDSKLCNVLFSRELNKRLNDRGIDIPIICWAPGLVIPRSNQGFFRYSRKNNELGQRLFAFLARDIFHITESPHRAGKHLMELALSGRYSDPGFSYYTNKLSPFSIGNLEKGEISKEANDSFKAMKIWDISNQLISNYCKLENIY